MAPHPARALALLALGLVLASSSLASPANPRSSFAGSRALLSNGRHLHQTDAPTGGYVWASGTVEVALKTPDAATTGVAAIAAGGSNTMALLSNGSAVGWGSMVKNGQSVYTPLGGTRVKAISAGYKWLLALLANGAVVQLDEVNGDRLTIPATLNSGVKQVVAGAFTFVGVKEDGSLVNFGNKDFEKWQVQTPAVNGGVSQVSIGFKQEQFSEVTIDQATGNAMSSLSIVDLDKVMILFNNGTIKVYGDDRYNQSQVPAEAQNQVTSIAAGGSFCMSIVAGGKVVAWGDNSLQQLAVPAEAQSGVTQIAAGQDHALALVNGRVVCWGDNGSDQCKVPQAALAGVKAIAAGRTHSIALLSNSAVLMWGTVDSYRVPVSVPNLLRSGSSVVAVAAGDSHDLALLSDSTVVGFGDNREGQVSVPPQLSQTGGVRAIAAGQDHSLALLYTGEVVSWGNSQGAVPATVTGVEGIAAGQLRSCVLLSSDKSIQCFGYDINLNRDAIQGVRAKKIDMKWGTALALLEDGSVLSFGDGSDANPRPEGAQANVVDIAAGSGHGLALLSNGTLIGFHTDSVSQGEVINIPAEFRNNVSSFSAGPYTSQVVRKDGRAIVLGNFCDEVECAVPPAGVLRMAAGYRHVLAVLDPSVRQPGSSTVTPNPGPAPATGPATTPGSVPATIVPAPNTVPSDSRQISSGTPAPGTPTSSSSSSSKGKTIGIAVGVAAGVVALLALIGLLVWRKKRSAQGAAAGGLAYNKSGSVTNTYTGSTAGWGTGVSVAATAAGHHAGEALNLKGMAKGELFAKTTAHEYTWAAVSAEDPGMQCVEAGINDVQLDTMVADKSTEACPVVQLTAKELKEQIHLLKDGLLGKGATAVAFKALWPARFGPNAVLAVKVLKDGHDADMAELQSFSYEAGVLSSTRHPNVVRIYGYCMEPPTVCLVLEVLQQSLKDLLYTPNRNTTTSQGTYSAANTGNMTNITSTNMSGTNGQSATTNPSTVYITMTDGAAAPEVTQPAPGPASNLTAQTSQPGPAALNMARVIEISADIAAGLAYLHDTPLTENTTKSMRMFGPLDGLAPVISEAESAPGAGLEQPGRQARIVHRDLKPANILLNSRGEAKISDFGLAREHNQTTVQTERVGAGTLPYMAPELLMGSYGTFKSSITNKVDIYSTAMILYEMVAHEMAWKGMGEMAILAAVTGGRRPDLPLDTKPADSTGPLTRDALTHLAASVTALPEFNTIIRACWHQREYKRPTASQLHAMLIKLLDLPETDPSQQP